MRERLAVHRAIVVVDVEGFGDPVRTSLDQLAVRAGLYEALPRAFAGSGIGWDSCLSEDRGDGALILVPPEVPKALLVTGLPGLLAAAVSAHNAGCSAPERMRLRMALHAGEVYHDAHGVAGAAVNHAFRLAEAAELRSALAAAPGVLALIVSDWFFSEVVRHDPAASPGSYRRVTVNVKETAVAGWIRVPDPGAAPGGDGQAYDVARQGAAAIAVPESRSMVGRGPAGGAAVGLPGLRPAIAGIGNGGRRIIPAQLPHDVLGMSLTWLGAVHERLGSFETAISMREQGVAALEQARNRWQYAYALRKLADACHHNGRAADAIGNYQRAQEIVRQIGDRRTEADILLHLGYAQEIIGQADAARQSWQQALTIFEELRDPRASQVRTQLRTG